MNITLSNAGFDTRVELPQGTELGHVRTMLRDLEDIGAPGSYTLAVGGVSREENYLLQPDDIVTFRPLSGEKGNG